MAALGDLPSAQDPLAIDSTERSELGVAGGVSLVLEGLVLGPDGNPAEGAVVASTAGGRAVTDVTGSYRLEVQVPPETTSVQVTAVSSAQGTLVASSSIAMGGRGSVIRPDPLQLARGVACSPAWLPTFGGEPGTNDWIFALAVYDDGGGPALYAGGTFTTAAGTPVGRIAKWDGASWSELGGGVSHAQGAAYVEALGVYDDGGGPALYVGGHFTLAGGVPANHIAKWDGTSWSALGNGTNRPVAALVVHDDGSGLALYAGGSFSTAGRALVSNVAKWDGTSWSRLGGGPRGSVNALAVYDDGGGPALYAGGIFTAASGVPANSIAKWDGTSWSSLGTGLLGPTPGLPGAVQALAVHDDGGGPALFVGGNFDLAGGVRANHIAKWDGTSWSALADGMGSSDFTNVSALTVFDDGGGQALYAGGNFGGYVKKWDGSSWSALAGGVNSFVDALAVYDDGSGPALCSGGNFTAADGVPVRRIAKWDGASWSALGGGLVPYVAALAAYDDGGGAALYAGGDFTVAGGVAANRIAKWDGLRWSALGSGFKKTVRALAVYDDGGGPALYAGGEFTLAGGVPANHIARWDGSSWSALGSGMDREVVSLAVYDDGGGPALYAGGNFTTAGGVPASHIARWDGWSWSALGSGVSDSIFSLQFVQVHALAVHDDGSGPALYAGGRFTTAGGAPTNHIAKWDGTSWSALGSGVDNPYVYALAVYDEGVGRALYAGGIFTSAGGTAANGIARWDGSDWKPLGSGVSHGIGIPTGVLALAVFDGPERGGPALFAGGDFASAFDSGDSYLARWQGCPDKTPPVLSCPTSVTVPDPRSGPPGEIVTFTVTASDDRDGSPSLKCEPPSGTFFPPGVTLVQCKATDRAHNQSTCSFPVVVQRK